VVLWRSFMANRMLLLEAHHKSGQWDRVVKVMYHNNCSCQKPCVLNACAKEGAIVPLEQSDTYPRF
jgi:hypothetical protein